jgi:hypothetical protein
MPDPLLSTGLAHNWISALLKQGAKIWVKRKGELREIFDVFGDPELLARSYIEPNCQPINPADLNEAEPLPTRALRVPVRSWINEFLGGEFFERDGRNTLFVLSDAGMGKSSLLMMLKLTEILGFWPTPLSFRLLKLGPESIGEIKKVEDRKTTVLLLDSIDEDPTAWGRIEERIVNLLHESKNFRQVIITCRTQFFPKTDKAPIEGLGKILFPV